MQIAVLSDLHGNFPKLKSLKEDPIDLLLVAGDIAAGLPDAQYGSMKRFFDWVNWINPKHMAFTPGNHDYWLLADIFKLMKPNHYLLIDDWVTIEGVKIYGTPWTLPFFDWNWMKPEDRLALLWENIPEDLDILISHGPAYKVCDLVPSIQEHTGSKTLREAVLAKNIKYFFSGHIHEGSHSQEMLGNTKCRCVSLMSDPPSKIKFEPYYFELDRGDR